MSPPSFLRLRRLRDGYASIVWHCIDDRIKRNVAVKFLANVKDAKDEVKILGHFCHPNVINVVDFIKWSDSFGIVSAVGVGGFFCHGHLQKEKARPGVNQAGD
jgi:serine/threonine protein kinase